MVGRGEYLRGRGVGMVGVARHSQRVEGAQHLRRRQAGAAVGVAGCGVDLLRGDGMPRLVEDHRCHGTGGAGVRAVTWGQAQLVDRRLGVEGRYLIRHPFPFVICQST